jgi:hypothetical protein
MSFELGWGTLKLRRDMRGMGLILVKMVPDSGLVLAKGVCLPGGGCNSRSAKGKKMRTFCPV